MSPEVCPSCGGRGVVPELKVCANDRCGIIFRWQDGRAGANQRTTGILYCSGKCAKATAQRRYRARLKVAP